MGIVPYSNLEGIGSIHESTASGAFMNVPANLSKRHIIPYKARKTV